MVKAGPKPKSSALKEANGHYKANPQRRNKREPKLKPGYPEMPATLRGNKVAQAKWTEICDTLFSMKVLTKTDAGLLEAYCLHYADWLGYRKHIKKHGIKFINQRSGSEALTPECRLYESLSDRLLKMLAELGLTPSARTRLQVVGEGEEADGFNELLAKMSGRN